MASPAIVFVHGLFTTPRVWENWLLRFSAQGYPCEALPLPGCGRTPAELRASHPNPGLARPTFADVVDHVSAEVERLGGQTTVVGHGIGGLVAQILVDAARLRSRQPARPRRRERAHVERTGGIRWLRPSGWALGLVLLAAASGRALAEPHEPASDNALAILCGIVEDSAKAESLPVNFFTRLIWRESAFQPRAVSPAGAQGVAQFMPGTASERGLADPFDPATAIPASAKLLADLELRFGNLGLAAAAYNAGPNALEKWLDGQGEMPFETQQYVLAITGHDIEEWRALIPPASSAPGPAEPCIVAISRLRVARGPSGAPPLVSGLFAPWGVQLSASFSKDSALRSFARVRHEYASVIGDMQPFVLGSVLRSRGWRPFYRVRLPAQTGGEAKRLCDRIQAVGGACAVLRS